MYTHVSKCKNNEIKNKKVLLWAGGMAKVVEHLSSKSEALSSKP
jgi:hypothetical protein